MMRRKRCGGGCTLRIENEDVMMGPLTLRSSGIRIERRKVPKRNSCMGIDSFGAWIPFSVVPWGKASDRCVVLYVGRLSPKTTRSPSEICSEMSFVFIPGISNTAVRIDSAGSSMKSILEKKVSKGVKNVYISDVPWSVFRRGRWNRLRCNGSKLPRFYGLHAFEICSSVDSLDKSTVPKRFEALIVCNLMSWIHCKMTILGSGYYYILDVE